LDSETEVVLRTASPVVPVSGQQFIVPPGHIVQPQRQAMAAVRKFTSPPIFRGSPDEDARKLMERYETISYHNGWGDAEKRNNFNMYLDDTGRNWFLCARIPNDWEDTTEHPAAGGNPATPAVTGLRSILVDSNMSEAHRLERLFRGLRPALLRKIYPLKPKTCEEFLTLAKAYTEAWLMSEARGWKDAAMEPQKPLEQAPNLSVVYPDQQAEFMKSM
ncbi:Uncharacterized protein APZ42_000748, partial [Daphnia magna]